MKKTLFLLISLLAITVGAQDIKTIPLPEKFYDIETSPSQPYLVMLTRSTYGDKAVDNGDFCVVDMKTGKPLWVHELNYLTDEVRLTNNGVLYSSENDTRLYDFKTGDIIHRFKTYPEQYDVANDLLFGYQKEKGGSLKCFSLKDGKEMWKTKLKKSFWAQTERWNGDTILLTGQDICLLDGKTGITKTYKVKTEMSNKKYALGYATGSMIAAHASAVLFGLGVYRIPEVKNITSLCSNVLVEEDRIYMSDREHLFCLDRNLNEVWRYDFPKQTAAFAQIQCKGDTLYMLNEGYGVLKGNLAMAGKPFHATFNKHTGENYRLDYFPNQWDENLLGTQLLFPTDNIFIMDEDGEQFTRISGAVYPYFLNAPNDDIVQTDASLQPVRTIPSSQLYYFLAEKDGRYLVGHQHGSDLEIIGLDSACRLQFRVRTDATLLRRNKEKFFFRNGDKLIVADWDALKDLP